MPLGHGEVRAYAMPLLAFCGGLHRSSAKVIHGQRAFRKNSAALNRRVQGCPDRKVTLMLSPHRHPRPRRKPESEVKDTLPAHTHWLRCAENPQRFACPRG